MQTNMRKKNGCHLDSVGMLVGDAIWCSLEGVASPPPACPGAAVALLRTAVTGQYGGGARLR